MHLGSQLFALEPYRRAIRALGSLGEFATYDLGGGLGVPYTAGDPQLDVETWVAGMVEAAPRSSAAAASSCSSWAARSSPTPA